jgi:hypothetical protein
MKRVLQDRLEELEASQALATQSGTEESAALFDASSLEPPDQTPMKGHVAQLQTRTLAILQRAERVGRADLILRRIREARSNLELLARLTGQFDIPGNTRITAVVVMPSPATTESLREAVRIEVTRSCPHL